MTATQTTKKESKALAPKGASTLTVPEGFDFDGALDGATSNDYIIPKILLMQGLSEFVAEGKAQMGDFMDSLSQTRLGSHKEPLEFVPLKGFKTWVIYTKKQGQWEYDKTEACTPENDNWKWEETLNGVEIKREKRLNFIILLFSDIAKGEPFPKVITFKSTSMNAGKQLETLTKQLSTFKVPYIHRAYSLSAIKSSNDKGTFYVLNVSRSRVSKKMIEARDGNGMPLHDEKGNPKMIEVDYWNPIFEHEQAPIESAFRLAKDIVEKRQMDRIDDSDDKKPEREVNKGPVSTTEF